MQALSLRQRTIAWLTIGGIVTSASAAGPAENAYDTLGKLLLPFASILAEHPGTGGNRAVTFSVRVESSKGFPAEIAGQRADLAVEYPDKLRLHAPWFGEEFTLCRRGDLLWVSPGSKLKELLARPDVVKRLPEPDRRFHLRPFGLPVPEKDLVFLPALFHAETATPETIEGVPCHAIDFQPVPAVGKALGITGWTAWAWVNAQDQPERIAVQSPETEAILRVEKLTFAPKLPPETWTPAKGEEGDVMIVPPVRYDQILRAIVGQH